MDETAELFDEVLINGGQRGLADRPCPHRRGAGGGNEAHGPDGVRKLRLGPPSVHWLGVERPPPPALPADRVLAPLAIRVVQPTRPISSRCCVRCWRSGRTSVGAASTSTRMGPVSPITGRRFAEDADIEACRELFRQLIPWGEERFTGSNLGVAKNYRRAEEELFADPANAIVYFFEDDLVLHPHLSRSDGPAGAENPRTSSAPVGQFAAYGGLVDPLWRQYLERYRLQRMAHQLGLWPAGAAPGS